MVNVQEIAENVILGKNEEVKELVKKALNENADAEKLLRDGLIAGMSVVGERFKNNEMYIPEVILSARAMKTGMEILKPILVTKNIKSLGAVVMGTVKGDLHDIGKNLVNMMFEGAGFDVIDLGVDVPEETFVQVVREKQPKILGLSALLTTTMPAMREVIKALESSGLRHNTKVVIGGAPVTEEFAAKIGADGYARDAGSVVDKVKELLS
jgi:5-methyltetrahydrofolate--homocysteine methyltransferase